MLGCPNHVASDDDLQILNVHNGACQDYSRIQIETSVIQVGLSRAPWHLRFVSAHLLGHREPFRTYYLVSGYRNHRAILGLLRSFEGVSWRQLKER
jgi:hypothetical protein